MKIRLWQPFRADFVRRGHRKPERLTTRTPIDVEIPAISASEIGVVGRLVVGDARWSRVGAGDDGLVAECRGWNGNLYRPMEGPGQGGVDVATWIEAMTEDPRMIAQIGADPILLAHTERTGDDLRNWAKVFPPEELDGEIVADDKADCVAAAEEWSRDLLLVEGKLWRRAPAPTWLVEMQANGIYTVHLSAPPCIANFYGQNRVAGFQADRRDDTMAWIEAFGRHRHRTPQICDPSGSLEDFDPAYLRRDDLGIETSHLGRIVLHGIGSQISTLTTSGVGHYAAARDVLDLISSGRGDATDVATFLAEVDALAEDMRRFGYPTDSHAGRDTIMKSVDHLEWRIRRGEAPALALGFSTDMPDLGGIGPNP